MRILLAIVFCLLTTAVVFTQTEPQIDLVKATFNPLTANLELQLRALDRNGLAMESLRPQDVEIMESVNEGPLHPISIGGNRVEIVYDTVNLREDTVQVLFLLDMSREVSGQQFDQAKEAISDFFNKFTLSQNANYFLQPFDDDFASDLRQISPDEYVAELALLEPTEAAPDLYRAIIDGLRAVERWRGKKIVFLISPGSDQSAGLSRYEGAKLPPLRSDVLDAVREFSDDLYLFPINPGSGISDTTDLFAELTRASRQTDDVATVNGRLPDELNRIIESRQVLISTHRWPIETPNGIFQGLPRELILRWSGRDEIQSQLSYDAGSFNSPLEQGERINPRAYSLGGIVGLGLVLLLLTLFAFVFPKLRQAKFRRQHLVAYQPVAGRQVMDPLTREPIQSGELVVNICRQVIPWQTWRECGHTCPRFPGCTTNNLQCKGAGGIANVSFFTLQGPNRRLNWIWFGALGGFLAWIIASLIFVFGQNWIDGLSVWARASFSDLSNANGLINEVLLGASFGLGISLLLGIIIERTESRRFSYSRILLRTLLGGLLALLMFGGSFLLFQQGMLGSALIAGGLAWVLFGLSLGLVLSLFGSSVSLWRGLMGGFLAGLISFSIYSLLGTLSEDFLLAKVVGLVAGGAFLGGILDTVVQLTESYEMEFLRPANYRRNVPLSKWLGSGSEIIIGTQPGSQVYVKWPDEAVVPEHAKLKLEGERVYLIPLSETLVNGQIINQKRIQLQDKDLIQLGRHAVTQMRFLQKQEAR